MRNEGVYTRSVSAFFVIIQSRKYCESSANARIRKKMRQYLFGEVTYNKQITSKLVIQESIKDAILRM